MNKHKKLWKRLAIIAGIALGIYLIVGIVLAGFNAPPIPPEQSGITLNGGRVNGDRISTKSWSFDYDRAQLSPDGSSGTITGVHNGIMLKHGKPYATIDAAQISVDTNSLNFTATGKVHVALIGDSDHRSFDTDLVQWTDATKQLVLSHPSYLHSADQTLTIASATVDFNTNQVHIGAINGGFHLPNP